MGATSLDFKRPPDPTGAQVLGQGPVQHPLDTAAHPPTPYMDSYILLSCIDREQMPACLNKSVLLEVGFSSCGGNLIAGGIYQSTF